MTKPKSQSALSGQDVLLECQAQGDPYPDIEWTKEVGLINTKRAKVIPGKGIRIESVTLEDAGTYVCTANNVAGSVTVESVLKVFEPAEIIAAPSKHVQVPMGEKELKLDCEVQGSPKPLVAWSKEGYTELLFPGGFYEGKNRISVSKNDGSLTIKQASVKDSGHFTCFVLNRVGSEMANSHVFVYDAKDFEANSVPGSSLDNVKLYEQERGTSDEMNQARKVLAESATNVLSAYAVSSSSIKLIWNFETDQPKLLSGFRIWFKQANDPNELFKFVEVAHPEVSSYVLNRLREFTDYEIFIQPFYKTVSGVTSRLLNIQTHPALPSTAPVLIESRLMNASTIFLAWSDLNEREANGQLEGYEVNLGLINFL